MRTLNFGKALALALLLFAPLVAQAAGLGRLTVQSSLGQPLSAEIDLVAVRGDEASNLIVRLGSPEAYQQANLQYNSSINGLKLSIERRANGQAYVKITGNRPVSEPFVDLLIELTGAGSRLLREYTALLDPPGYGQQAVQTAPAPMAAPESRPIAAAPAAPAPKAAAPAAASGAQEYGPIAKGETLGKIAASLKPEGVSLEQMLVALYRNNPDAFIKKNLNLVKSGKILRVPDAAEVAAITKGEAAKEYRTHVADWRAYVGKVADAAGQAAAGGSTARGKITAKVEDTGGAPGSKDVVKLSKGEPGKDGKPLSGAAKARAATEDKIAGKQELAEAKDRIAQLETTVKNGQKLAELKSPGMAAAQQKAEAAKAGPAPVAKADAAKPEVKGAETAPPPAEAKKDGAVSTPPNDKPVADAKPAPKPKPKPVAPPPPPPEPGIMDMVMDNLPIIGGGVGALVLGGLGFAALRRRRARAMDDDAEPARMAPEMGAAAAAETTQAAAPADEVDPIAEAEVYIAYGRDGQAEDILKEAMGRDPSREDVQVKLAEVYATRKDAVAFGNVAQSLHALTGGAGDNWNRIVALGYTVDPDNALYAAGKDAAPQVDTSTEHTGTDLDFDLGGDSAATPDIALDADTAGQATEMGGGMHEMASAADAGAPGMPDFNLEAPAPGTETDIALEASPADQISAMDFNIELPSADTPTQTAKPAAPAADAGLDFKIDVGDLNISLDEPPTSAAPAADKDSHWYDVQQKFDLAKAYQEMGDNDGAREILQEVIKEGDAEQKDQAQKLLGSLG